MLPPPVVYLLIPTSNHNFVMSEILPFGCISFDSYIKPQLSQSTEKTERVVYLLIPTSNHNCLGDKHIKHSVVYLLIPTSNHNPEVQRDSVS